ncbi:MAG: glycosyltransferase family 39 protein [Anaerolineae bacterium]
MKRYFKPAIIAIFLGISFILAIVNFDSAPPFWRDEGWTLSVARNWIQTGFYGLVLNGQPASSGQAAAFPTVGLMALSFRLFGVGVWQGRAVSAVLMAGALILLYLFGVRLENRRIALGAVAFLLFASILPELNPLYEGRQILAEPLMLFLLLAGYLMFWFALDRLAWFIVPAILFWGIALFSKAQPLPFFAVSLLAPLVLSLAKREWRMAGLWALGLGGSLLIMRLAPLGQQILLAGHTVPNAASPGLVEATAFVPTEPTARISAFFVAFVLAIPTTVGLIHAAWRFIRSVRWKEQPQSSRETMRLALLTFTGSWFAWYLMFSIGWVRYLFPAAFVGSLFTAAMLDDVIRHFDLRSLVGKGARVRGLQFDWRRIGAFLLIVYVILAIPFTIGQFAWVLQPSTTGIQTAEWLNSHTPQDAVIETYESELFLFLNRRYHYPSDDIVSDLIRRKWLDNPLPITYDPLQANPDYLVVGRFARENQIYDVALATGSFRLVNRIGLYDLYERVRQ